MRMSMDIPTGTYDGSGARDVCPSCGADFDKADIEYETATYEDDHREMIEQIAHCPVCGHEL